MYFIEHFQCSALESHYRFQNRSHLYFLVEVNSRAELYHAQRHRNQIKRNTHGLIEIRGCYSAYRQSTVLQLLLRRWKPPWLWRCCARPCFVCTFSWVFLHFQSKNKSHALKQHSRCKSAEKASVQRGNFLIGHFLTHCNSNKAAAAKTKLKKQNTIFLFKKFLYFSIIFSL